jgi:hypothetical protein
MFSEKIKLQKASSTAGTKRKELDTPAAGDEDNPKIKNEWSHMMPVTKVKHWAPDGYYHVKEVCCSSCLSDFL